MKKQRKWDDDPDYNCCDARVLRQVDRRSISYDEDVSRNRSRLSDANSVFSSKRLSIEEHSNDSDSSSSGSSRRCSKVRRNVCRYCSESVSNTIPYRNMCNAKTEEEVVDLDGICSSEELDKPQLKLADYRIYDKARHLCPFDGSLIQDNVSLFFSGYVHSVDAEECDNETGHPCEDMGPITEWWVAGYDAGQKAIIGISSNLADYYLIEPHHEYFSLMASLNEKIFLTKTVIDFLQNVSNDNDATYANLLSKLRVTVPPTGISNLTEDILIKHASFICDQIVSYDTTADAEEKLLSFSPCIRDLSDKLQIDLKEREKKMIKRKRMILTRKPLSYSKAATTRLVENVFENFFHGQMNKSKNDSCLELKHCTVQLTRLEEMGIDWQKYLLRSDNEIIEKKSCEIEAQKTRVLKGIRLIRLSDETVNFYLSKSRLSDVQNLIISESESADSESENEFLPQKSRKRPSRCDESSSEDESCPADRFKRKRSRRSYQSSVHWFGDPVKEVEGLFYFKSALINDVQISVGDFVTTFKSSAVARIKFLWENMDGEKLFHAHWFTRSVDTILGECGNPSELFVSDSCSNVKLDDIIELVDVSELPMLSNWNIVGNTMLSEWTLKAKKDPSDTKFFYQKRYHERYARFEDLEPELPGSFIECSNCEKQRVLAQKEIPYSEEKSIYNAEKKMYELSMICWREEEYRAGSCVFITPGTIMKLPLKGKENVEDEEKYDENLYPEKYRKYLTNRSNKNQQDDDNTFAEPFEIGYICEIWSKRQEISSTSDVKLLVKKFYRPQNTSLSLDVTRKMDLNLIYWSDDECMVDFSKVEGKCYVSYEGNLNCSVDEWTEKGPYRFYFNQTYNKKYKLFEIPTSFAKKLGNIEKCKSEMKYVEEFPVYPSISRPLRSLDVFAGCGGLSEGLHQANVAECYWAIEKDSAAAHAFRLNNPNATVFTDDCNELLDLIINNEKKKNGQYLPKKGEVELLCGGPPCQGFSGMNRFNRGKHSRFNNSLIVSYLSYCDYFRPRFFILENVRNFVSHEKSQVLKLTLNCLIKMGYQVTFGVLQCARFGIPQSRRRVIILAAAPGEILPMYPEYTHAFTQSKFLDVTIDNKKYTTNTQWGTSSPYRMITVYDALSDLPAIEQGDLKEKKSYDGKPITHFQRQLRTYNGKEEVVLKDHICKPLSALVVKRMSYVPRKPGCDWRDLPNIVVELKDGSFTDKLVYTHHDVRNGKSSTGALRGVCSCAGNSSRCDSDYRQSDTLIPWCLPHTGNRHNNWSGLYGRLSWDDYFRTVVTNPEPMGKQGRVVHPEEDRVISVRECARSQGFPDRFKFFGNVLDKHRQIGNAVAPPLAKALGLELKKSVNLVEMKVSSCVN